MNTFLWIITVILAVLTFVPGMVKVVQPREKLLEKMAWANDFSRNQIRAIGGLEVVAAVALIVPGIVGFVPVLVPLAACGIALLQVGAIFTHLKRREGAFIAINVIMIVLSVVIAWGRFGQYPL